MLIDDMLEMIIALVRLLPVLLVLKCATVLFPILSSRGQSSTAQPLCSK